MNFVAFPEVEGTFGEAEVLLASLTCRVHGHIYLAAANTFTFFTFENFWAVNPIRRVENWDIGIKIYVCVTVCVCMFTHLSVSLALNC